MSRWTPQQIINDGIRLNKTYKEINNALVREGYKPGYNPLLQVENYANLPNQLARGALQMGRDLRTFGGQFLKPINDISIAFTNAPDTLQDKYKATKEAFKKAVNNNEYRKLYSGGLVGGIAGNLIPRVGVLGGAMLGSQLATVGKEGVINSILSTYDTSIKDLANGRTSFGDVAQGIFRNPLYAGFDTAPVSTKLISAINKSVPTGGAPIRRQLLPGPTDREVNRSIGQYITSADARLGLNRQGLFKIESSPLVNRTELLKNIIMNEGNLNEKDLSLAKLIKKDLRSLEDNAVNAGVMERSLTRNNTIAQYVMSKLKDERIIHDDIVKILRGDKLKDKVTKLLNKDPELFNKINKYINDGANLYDKGDIAFFTQTLRPTTNKERYGLASYENDLSNNYFNTNRIIGQTGVDELSKVFDESLRYQINQLGEVLGADDVVTNVVKKYGEKVKRTELPDEIPGKIAISLDKFKENIKNQYNKRGTINIKQALNSSGYGDAVYLMDEFYVKMLENAFQMKEASWLKKLVSTFKKAVLAQPHWFALNRFGNISNHFMNGGTLGDYIDGLRLILAGDIPNELRQQTSFNSYTGEGSSLFSQGSLSKPLNSFIQTGRKFLANQKSMESVLEMLFELYKLPSDLVANPWFKFEAGFELLDRSANLVRQAKRLGSEINRDYIELIRESKVNKDLFHKLNNEVNKALGDYVGRRYDLPPALYNVLSEVVPFYRFLGQTARTTANQLMNHPLAFSTGITIPARQGNLMSNYYINKYNLNPEEYTGGIPYEVNNDSVLTIGAEELPIANILRDAGELYKYGDLNTILSPYWSSVPDALSFRKFGKPMTTPRTKKMNLEERIKDKPLANERARGLLNTILSNTNAFYRYAQKYWPEMIATVNGKGLQPRYDTHPFTQRDDGFKRVLPEELAGAWLGITTGRQSKNRAKSKRDIKRSFYQDLYYNKRVNQNKNRFKK